MITICITNARVWREGVTLYLSRTFIFFADKLESWILCTCSKRVTQELGILFVNPQFIDSTARIKTMNSLLSQNYLRLRES